MAPNKLNDQITESVAFSHFVTIAQASAQSLAIVEAVGAETIGASMHNAVRAQSNAQMLSAAAMTATCARILEARQIPPPPKDSSTKGDKPNRPDDGDGPPPLTTVAKHSQAAHEAIERVARDASMAKDSSDEASKALSSLGKFAAEESTATEKPKKTDDEHEERGA